MREKSFSHLLRSKGYKATPARLAMLEIFARQEEPVNAEFIVGQLKKTNEATVYRTLEAFERVGLIKKLDLRKGSAYYEFPRHHHHHIVCVHCGEVEDFDFCVLEKACAAAVLVSKKFARIKDHSFELFGVCNKCA